MYTCSIQKTRVYGAIVESCSCSFTLNAHITQIFARGGKHALAEQHISALRARGIEPEPLAWSLLVSAYGNGNEPVLGLERLRSLLGEGVPVSVRERVFVPLLLAHARQGKVQLA